MTSWEKGQCKVFLQREAKLTRTTGCVGFKGRQNVQWGKIGAACASYVSKPSIFQGCNINYCFWGKDTVQYSSVQVTHRGIPDIHFSLTYILGNIEGYTIYVYLYIYILLLLLLLSLLLLKKHHYHHYYYYYYYILYYFTWYYAYVIYIILNIIYYILYIKYYILYIIYYVIYIIYCILYIIYYIPYITFLYIFSIYPRCIARVLWQMWIFTVMSERSLVLSDSNLWIYEVRTPSDVFSIEKSAGEGMRFRVIIRDSRGIWESDFHLERKVSCHLSCHKATAWANELDLVWWNKAETNWELRHQTCGKGDSNRAASLRRAFGGPFGLGPM